MRGVTAPGRTQYGPDDWFGPILKGKWRSWRAALPGNAGTWLSADTAAWVAKEALNQMVRHGLFLEKEKQVARARFVRLYRPAKGHRWDEWEMLAERARVIERLSR